jgi:CRISPR-associated protein Csd2
MSAIQNRYEFVYLFDVENGNPNGDPDAGNLPRLDPETSNGLVTDVCLKRKVRNYIEIVKGDNAGYRIYIQEGAVLDDRHLEGYLAVGKDIKKTKVKTIKNKDNGKEEEDEIGTEKMAREWLCLNFFDIRTFGAVMVGKYNCGQVRGPVQINFARSIDPITPLEVSITRMAITKDKDTEDNNDKGAENNRTMGRKHIVPYALYRAEGYVSAPLAEKTGFSDDDLNLLWEALLNMFDHDHSAARGKMTARKLIVFKHATNLGSAPAHKLFELVTVERIAPDGQPIRQFTDYAVNVGNAPEGVEIQELR